MKKFSVASIIFVMVMLFSLNVYADSPITSTQFYSAYADKDIVMNAHKSGVLDLETAQFLASPDNPIDVKAAVINALGWDIKGKSNADKYANFILKTSVAELTPEQLSGNDSFCIGYLLALDNYFKSEKAEPFLERAKNQIPDSFSVAMVTAVVKAQGRTGAIQYFWEEMNRIETDEHVIKDMRPEAVKIIYDYMTLYKYFGIDKSMLVTESGSAVTVSFVGHSGPYKVEEIKALNENNEYTELDIASQTNIKIEMSDNSVKLTGLKNGLYKITFTNSSDDTASLKLLVTSKEYKERLNNSIILLSGSPNAYVNSSATVMDKADVSIVPLTVYNRTLLPIRFVAEKLGATVEWDSTTSTATINSSGRIIKVTEGSSEMIADGRKIQLDVSAGTYNNRLYIPLRALVEAGLGKKIFYAQGLIIVSDSENILDTNKDKDIINDLIMCLVKSPSNGQSNSITVQLGSEPPDMNSLTTTDSISHTVQNHVNEGLMRKGKDGNAIPGLAESWETSEDKLIWTFHLRDSKWSDGTPITAKDFEFAFLEALKKETESEYAYLYYIFKNGEAYNMGKANREDVGVKAVDDKTLVITLEKPAPYLLNLLTFENFAPVKQSFYEKMGAKYGTEANNLLYSGPWLIKQWDHGNKLVLVKNPYYWNNKDIKLNQIDFQIFNDKTLASGSFIYGNLDIVDVPTYPGENNRYELIGYDIADYPDGSTWYLEFNEKDKYLSNQNIRKALSYAINRKDFVEKTGKYRSLPAYDFTNPVVSGENGSFSDELGYVINDNDLTEAKRLLAVGLQELGLDSLPQLTYLTDNTVTAKRESETLVSYWKALGIDVKVDAVPFRERLQRMFSSSKNYQIVMVGWGADFNDPISFLDIFETGNGNNHTGYSNPEYDKLLNKIRNEKDSKIRMDMLKELEKILMEDMPISPIYYRNRLYVAKPYVHGVVRSWSQLIDLYWTSVD